MERLIFKIHFFTFANQLSEKIGCFLLFHKLRSLKDADFSNLMRRPLWIGLRHKRKGKGKTFKGGQKEQLGEIAERLTYMTQ